MPGNSRTETKKVLRDGNVEIGWGERSCGLLFFRVLLFLYIERVLAFHWRGALAALLQKHHFCFAMLSYCRSEFKVFTWRVVVARNTTGRKMMIILVDNLDLSHQKWKLAAQCCAMISCNIRLSQGSELRLFPAWIYQVIIFALFRKFSAGGGAWLLFCKDFGFYFAMTRMDNRMDVGWMSTGNWILMNDDIYRVPVL